MKVAISYRVVSEIDGPGVATRNLIDALVKLDTKNTYIVIYSSNSSKGRYKEFDHVIEYSANIGSKVFFDQVYIPYVCRKEKVDLFFSPKFSVPLLSRVKSVVLQRGSEYWTYPQFYDRLDLLYVNTFLPLYCKKSTRVLTLSDVLKNDLNKFINVPLEKITTIHSAPNVHFKKIDDTEYLETVRLQFNLPKERFILAVTKPYAAVGSKNKTFYPGKNTEAVIESFVNCQDRFEDDVKLVLLGKDVKETLEANYGTSYVNNAGFVFPGYIDQKYLPAIYNLSSLLSFPSYYESFGIPIVEAMACGCPVVTSSTGACPEIAGNAAVIVDPDNRQALTDATYQILSDSVMSDNLIAKGYARVADFTWEKSAQKLLSVLQSV